jgi:HlyD family secretion protein
VAEIAPPASRTARAVASPIAFVDYHGNVFGNVLLVINVKALCDDCSSNPQRSRFVQTTRTRNYSVKILALAISLLECGLLASCERTDRGLVQGYVEGEFVYVAAPIAAQLQTLSVDRGAVVKTGGPLFALESRPQLAAREEAARRVAQAVAQLEDVKLGQRPTEIAALRAQLLQAQATFLLSEKELDRQAQLLSTKAIAQADYDIARARRAKDENRVKELTANLEVAQLGSREGQITAAAENLKAQEAALASVEWNLGQMTQTVPVDGVVNDVLFRPGDWVGAGQPVVELLPPGNVKVRTFVSQTIIGSVHVGDSAQILVDGQPSPYDGRVTFVSPRAEFTPPTIYSQQMREKFVFLVELSVPPEIAAKLHPGQPVDVRFSIAAP